MKEPLAGTACYGLSINCKNCTHTHDIIKHTWTFRHTVHWRLFVGSVSSLPQLIEIVGRINVTSSTCVHEFSRFFWRFCRTFGKIFTSTKVILWHCQMKCLKKKKKTKCFFDQLVLTYDLRNKCWSLWNNECRFEVLVSNRTALTSFFTAVRA